jgi:hypothetical protein
MKAMRFALIAAAALFVAACLPVTTKHPVGTTTGFKSDPALLGIWKGRGEEKDDKDGYITFLNNGDGTMTALVFSPTDDQGEWETYTLQIATVGSSHVMNARAALKNGQPITGDEANTLFPLLYQIKNGSLTLSLLDDDATKAAIRSGRIEGTIDPGDMGDAHITAEPAVLDAFFASKDGSALFSKKLLTLHRID